MRPRTLIRRSLRFHWRAHLGVVLGAAVGSAALIGALVVGDSVRESLRERALERLGFCAYALAPRDRLFTARLADGLRTPPHAATVALALPALVTTEDGSARANHVTILGVESNLWSGNPTLWTSLPSDSVLLNEALAGQLAAKQGDSVIFRVHKPSAFSRDVPISPQSDAVLVLRLRVQGIVSAEDQGNLSLAASQVPPLNAFLRLANLQRAAKLENRANMILNSAGESMVELPLAQLRYWLRSRLVDKPGDVWDTLLKPYGWKAAKSFEVIPVLQRVLQGFWGLADAQLEVRALPGDRAVELSSERVFLEPPVVAAAGDFTKATNARIIQIVHQKNSLGQVEQLAIENGLTNRRPMPWTTSLSNNWVISRLSRSKVSLTPAAKTITFPRLVAPEIAASLHVHPILTYLVNLFRAGTNSTPYSMVTAAEAPWTPPEMKDDEILVNQWLADDLQVKPGDTIDLTYFLPDSAVRLAEATNRFRVRGIVPLEGLYADRTLMPEFPGLAKAESTHDWDAGFPLIHRIRDKDEAYWKQYRGTPKAFVTLAAGLQMWANRFGNLTAIRLEVPTNITAQALAGVTETNLLRNLKPEDVGLRFEPVREQALKAANEAQDFGQLFLGFSFFLIAAALILMALLFQFGLEQRVTEVGTFLALGFTPRQVRRLFLGEGVALAALGGVIGLAAGLGYAWAMLRGLTTIWRDAVNASALSFHASAGTLVTGAVASVVVSGFTIWLTLRKLARQPARELLVGEWSEGMGLRSPSPRPSPPGRGGIVMQTGIESARSIRASAECHSPSPGGDGRGEGELPFQSSSSASHAANSRSCWHALTNAGTVGWTALPAAILLLVWAVLTGDTSNAGIFFGAGSLLLIAGLAFTARLLRRWASAESQRRLTLRSLGFRGATRRRNRSLAVAGLLACGSFLIVAIGAFKLDADQNAWRRASGTGGFALIGESTLPLIRDLNTTDGREFYGLDEAALASVSFVPMRVRDGDDASCLNLNRAQKPRLLGVKPELLSARGAFPFAKLEKHQSQPTNGWQLLQSAIGYRLSAIELPAIGDANSIQWALHKKVGDTVDYVDERGQSFKVRLVGAVANSILQGSLLIDEAEFKRRFPGESGYRMFLIDAPSNRVAEVSATLSRAFQDVGLELTPATRRLAQFNAVQNTYLNTFQVLGGLGLLLGTGGLGVVVLRNVLERRGELALLLAVGFRQRGLRRLVLSEHGALLGLGLAIGMVAALAAILPTLLSPAAEVPYRSLALTLAGLLISGMLWTWLATWLALRGELLAALRNE